MTARKRVNLRGFSAYEVFSPHALAILGQDLVALG